MLTPEEKYLHDPVYRQMVDALEKLIVQGQFTPSELREMVIFACTNYEMRRLSPSSMTVPGDFPSLTLRKAT